MAFLATIKSIWPIQQHFFAPFWSALKKPTWGFKFLHISHQFIRQEKWYQIPVRLFMVFLDSIDLP